MNFLETDFKRRRLPKRSNSSKDRAGNLLSFKLSKYPTFKRKIVSLIDDSKSEFSVEIGRGKFKSIISENLTELITEQTIRKLNDTRGQLIEILNEQLNKLFIMKMIKKLFYKNRLRPYQNWSIRFLSNIQ